MSDPNDNSIPVLHEVLVPGRPADTRPDSNHPGMSADSHAPREPGFRSEPAHAPQGRHGEEPVFAPQPTHAAEPVLEPQPLPHQTAREPQPKYPYDDPLIPRLNDRLQEPFRHPPLAPQYERVSEPHHQPVNEPVSAPVTAKANESIATDPGVFDRGEPITPTEAGATVPPDLQSHVQTHPQPHEAQPLLQPSGQPAVQPQAARDPADPGVFDRVEPITPLEAGATVPPDIEPAPGASHQAQIDADLIADRLRGRFAGFLTGEGRGLVEARCRDALHEHTSALVGQITREVALTLETEMTRWVREAVEEEIARRG